MSIEMIALLIVSIVIVSALTTLLAVKIPKPLNKEKYTSRWRDIQGLCKDKASWSQAIIEADQLLDLALRKRKFKGSSPGERLVSAQHNFTNNEGVWFAHNLYKKLIASPNSRLKEDDVKKALTYFRQALRDLGALPNAEQQQDAK